MLLEVILSGTKSRKIHRQSDKTKSWKKNKLGDKKGMAKLKGEKQSPIDLKREKIYRIDGVSNYKDVFLLSQSKLGHSNGYHIYPPIDSKQ